MDLEALVKERKKEAEDKQILLKANMIAKYLGQGSEESSWKNKERIRSESWNYSDDYFLISYECKYQDYHDFDSAKLINNTVSVKYRGNTVFHYQNPANNDSGIDCHVPGVWENDFNKLYQKANEANRRKRAEEISKKEEIERKNKEISESELRRRFGL